MAQEGLEAQLEQTRVAVVVKRFGPFVKPERKEIPHVPAGELDERSERVLGRLPRCRREVNVARGAAVALGLAACSQGRRVAFRETSQLVLELKAAHEAGALKQKLDMLARNELIILDEWGYLPCDPDGAKLLFRVISMCYERRSLLFTTNIDFLRWAAMFSDPDMAQSMLDRAIHHGRLITYDRESYRVKNSLMRADAAAAG